MAGQIAGERRPKDERLPVNYEPETILTLDQVADWLQLSPRKVETLKIKSFYIGNRRRYLARHVLEWVDEVAS